MAIDGEPKVDCHNHVFDPVRFPYAADAHYMPLLQETGTAAQFQSVLDAHGVRHALIVGPNSGYGQDNRCLLDAIAASEGRFKRIAVDQPGFRALLGLARNGRTCVKLSGHVKYSQESYPYADTWPYVRALVEAYTLDACVWASDWPFLRAPHRVDYGPLVALVERMFPNIDDRRKLLWDTPRRVIGF